MTAVAFMAVELRELHLQLPTAPLSPVMPPTSSVFKADEDAKAVQIDIKNPGKTVQIGASLHPK
jgi:hypothetical protein